jgi:hypothetical protein
MVETELTDVVRRLAVTFERRKVQHALIGGLAVGLRSRPRATMDADFILNVSALAFPGLLEDLIEQGFTIDEFEAIRRWSADRFLAFTYHGVRIDWMQPVIPLYATVLKTAQSQPWRDAHLSVATPEGLILTKMVAFRPQDQADIETLLIANRDNMDVALIRQEWSQVAEGEELRTAWLQAAIERHVTQRK